MSDDNKRMSNLNALEALEQSLHKFGDPIVDKRTGPNEAAIITVLIAQLRYWLDRDDEFVDGEICRAIGMVALHISVHSTLPITHMLFAPSSGVKIVLLSVMELTVDYITFKDDNNGKLIGDTNIKVRARDRYTLTPADDRVCINMKEAYTIVRQLVDSNINMALLGGIELIAREPYTIIHHLDSHTFAMPSHLRRLHLHYDKESIAEIDIGAESILPLILKYQRGAIVPSNTHFKAIPSVEVFDRNNQSLDIANVLLYEGTATVRNGTHKTLLTGTFIVKYDDRPCVFFKGTGIIHSNGTLLSGVINEACAPDERTLYATGTLNIYQERTNLCHMQVYDGATAAIYRDVYPRLGGMLYRFAYATETRGSVKIEAEVYALCGDNGSVVVLSNTNTADADSFLNSDKCIVPLSGLIEWAELYMKKHPDDCNVIGFGYRGARYYKEGNENYVFKATDQSPII